MKYGFIKCAAASPKIKVADVDFNKQSITELIKCAHNEGVKLLALPELCLTGATCGDLFLHKALTDNATKALLDICKETKKLDIVFAIGMPVVCENNLYNCACVVYKGEILGFVPKTNLKGEHTRVFSRMQGYKTVCIDGKCYPIGTNIVFENKNMTQFAFGVEICEDAQMLCPNNVKLCAKGANIILNLSASNELVGKSEQRRSFFKTMSAHLCCGYVFANAGEGESTTDSVYNSQCMILENGKILCEKEPFIQGIAISETDVEKINSRRIASGKYKEEIPDCDVVKAYFDMEKSPCVLTRIIEKNPFIPTDDDKKAQRCEEILKICAKGLEKRFIHSGSKTMVIGISGGLDSCLALLVAVKCANTMGLPTKNIIAVTMPCFGTTSRTKSNAHILCELLGVTVREINISKSVLCHFEDIGHDKDTLDVTYENAQARERTQVLMDIANKFGGLVVGTGDLSELALGWATYNGDHMSMYGVNASVPKTLVRCIIKHLSKKAEDKKLCEVLSDVAQTPVSPELLPPDASGKIAQVTEDLVGPYELHDFFIYHFLRNEYQPGKILELAKNAFEGQYSSETIEKWLRTFVRRFFAMQFKRSCLPDGAAVGTVTLSPRGGLKMPSDAISAVWLKDMN